VPRVVGILKRAEEAGRLLETGEVRFRADLARRTGVSAMRITYLLSLLKLAPAIKAFVKALPAGTPERMVTERKLRLMSSLPRDEQVRRAMVDFPGFRCVVQAGGMTGAAGAAGVGRRRRLEPRVR
jgi:hypothetical protein